jgi:hypothetical protein
VKSTATDDVDRIAVYVSDRNGGVRFADHWFTPVPRVEEWSSSTRPTVVTLSMGRLDPTDRLGEICVSPFHEPMEMIGHQRVRAEDYTRSLEAIQHDLLEVEPVGVQAEDVLPVDASVDDVEEVGGAEVSVSFGHVHIHWVMRSAGGKELFEKWQAENEL